MRHRYFFWQVALLWSLLFLPTIAYAQGTQADYERAASLRNRFQGLAVNIVERPTWIGKTSRFWYRRAVKGGNEFMVVDAETLAKKPAFDHEKLAGSLSTATGKKYTAVTLPFMTITFVDNEQGIEFIAEGSRWRCELSDLGCRKLGPAPAGAPFRRQDDNPEEPPAEYGNDVVDGMVDLSTQAQQGTQTQAQQFQPPLRAQDQEPRPKTSPDGKWEAFIQNYIVFLRAKGKTEAFPLSFDGSEGDYYTLASISWSPDSRHLAAYCVRPGYRRQVHYIESSPTDQLQPKSSTREYATPGDDLDFAHPVL